jgi:hypothetical protein
MDPEFTLPGADDKTKPRRSPAPAAARTPSQLFTDYCAERMVSDSRVTTLFDQLHDEVTSGPAAEPGAVTATGKG